MLLGGILGNWYLYYKLYLYSKIVPSNATLYCSLVSPCLGLGLETSSRAARARLGAESRILWRLGEVTVLC